ncbi:helix-turn-helix domain-containing protein [Alkalicoccus daliensis]|uniref:Uncharacterized protein YpbB n=1 Tax=Alkalicoccus daliensis TaxID=745820 RepID=A0A1H0AXH1_9BACI|nr:helix-turn-helix domain-containing protein [Alkalicoccus daliensis]SDN38160.1 Uncharacterized protein YpbB [Alkalicoccus daliensis]
MDILILNVLNLLRGERSLSGAIHILKGKRSAQTIQDISLYNLEKWAAALKLHSYTDINKIGVHLYNRELIVDQGKQTLVTNKGKEIINKAAPLLDNINFQGRKYEWNNEAENFWRRLSLLIQTVSYVKAGQYQFIPVLSEYQDKNIVKQLLRSHSAEQIVSELEPWLYHILNQYDEKDAHIFVDRLSGYNYHGATLKQLAAKEGGELAVYLKFRSMLHFFLENQHQAPGIFHQLFPLQSKDKALTKTAIETRFLVNKGYAKEEIAAVRSLKTSTIEDHLVELAMYDNNFPYQAYIEANVLDRILKMINAYDKVDGLKQIREKLNREIDYFEIRLAMALKYNWKEGDYAAKNTE